MNSYLFSAIALCLAAQCALAQYQSAPAYGSGYQQQRKMAPTPQTYGQQQSSYGASESYGGEPAPSYKAPAAPQYEATPTPSYSKPSSYGRQQSSGYGAPKYEAPAYAKPAPKYEEPYHPPMPFAWGYDINDGYGGAQYHKENGDEYGKRTGSYGYTDAYGIYRQVDYVADEHGFRATIKTNEPGTANESPADVELHAYEPPSNYYAGNKDSSYSAPPKAAYSAPQQQSYGAQSNSYTPPAPPKYEAPQQQYSAPQPQYSRPQSYSPRSSYSQSKQSSSYAAPNQRQSYEPAAQYSSSVIVPVYQKANSQQAPIKATAAKRY